MHANVSTFLCFVEQWENVDNGTTQYAVNFLLILAKLFPDENATKRRYLCPIWSTVKSLLMP